jgi:hypothetical protein
MADWQQEWQSGVEPVHGYMTTRICRLHLNTVVRTGSGKMAEGKYWNV